MASMPEGSAGARSARAPRRRGYLRRHWSGELSLAKSFWLNGVLAALIVIPLIVFALSRIAIWAVQSQYALLAASAVALALAFPWPLMVWQMVGIWRAAGRTRRERGRRLGPWLARGAVIVCGVFGLTAGAAMVAERLPLIGELHRAASGDAERGERRYAVTSGGRELIVAGPIAIGSVEEIKAELARHPKVEVLRLEGPGGRIAPARELRELVVERGLSTYTTGQCVSACTFIFISGLERILKKGAKLGFHRPGLAGMTDAEMEVQAAMEREAMRTRGIADWFIDKAMTTPFESIWFPTEDELLRAAVVTRVTDGSEFGLNPLEADDVEKLDDDFSKLPILAAIKQAQADRYDVFLRDARTLMREGAQERALSERAKRMVREAVAEAVTRTSDVAARNYARVMAAEQRKIAEVAPAHCGRASAAEVDLGTEVTQTRLTALARIVSEADATRPQPDEQKAQDMLRVVRERLAQKHGQKILRLLAAPPNDPGQTAAYCEAVAIFFETFAAASEPQAGAALRWLLAQQFAGAETAQ